MFQSNPIQYPIKLISNNVYLFHSSSASYSLCWSPRLQPVRGPTTIARNWIPWSGHRWNTPFNMNMVTSRAKLKHLTHSNLTYDIRTINIIFKKNQNIIANRTKFCFTLWKFCSLDAAVPMDPAIGPPVNSMPNQPHSMLRCPVHPVSSAFQHLAASPTFQCYSVTRLERLKWVLHVYQIRMNFTRRYVRFSYLIYNIRISYILYMFECSQQLSSHEEQCF